MVKVNIVWWVVMGCRNYSFIKNEIGGCGVFIPAGRKVTVPATQYVYKDVEALE